MAWYAKPSGSYTITSNEAKANIFAARDILVPLGYTLECCAGILGNAYAESGLNPWRWENDTVSYSKGYGLFQYTPASGYIPGCSSFANYAPNTSTTQTVSTASPNDAIAQINVYASNYLNKWINLCWREGSSYAAWESIKQSGGQLWQDRRRILNKYAYEGANGITQEQFKAINNVYDATFVQLACFEGPAVPNMSQRESYANTVYEILSGQPPIPPTPTSGKKMKLIYYLRRK